MKKFRYFRLSLMGLALAVAQAAAAANFDIPGGDLKAALNTYTTQAGVQLLFSGDAVHGARTKGVKGALSPDEALMRILSGTGFIARREADAIAIIPADRSAIDMPYQLAAAPAPSASGAALETVTVTSSKIGGDVQNIPIAITALSQEQLTSRQIAGGPDLVKQVPNLTFTKTNFTGYSIQIRGIGTQAISVSTDPAVAIALNDIPFIRNHFFEQEFYDLSQAEVLRGPQGTLYGRNATAGVVNLVTAKPTDQFEAMASADFGNYMNRRFEGMINIPVVDDRLDIRAAGEWTKRDGYSFNELTGTPIDGRDLWSGRLSVELKPFQNLQTTLVWEHFSEDDDRMRTSKQLCTTMPMPTTIGGQPFPTQFGIPFFPSSAGINYDLFSQGCKMGSLYAPSAFGEAEPWSLPYVAILGLSGRQTGVVPYANNEQSQNLRVIDSAFDPVYKARNDTVELNSDLAITPQLTLTSQTGYNTDFLWSTEDYNRYNSAPGVFANFDPTDPATGNPIPNDTVVTNPFPITYANGQVGYSGTFCDPQVGCSDRIVARDVSDEHAWQLSQEFRLASNFSGPLNFSFGGNYLHYETEENYYVFINSLTLTTIGFYSHNLYGSHTLPNGWTPGPFVWTPGVSDNMGCQPNGAGYSNPSSPATGASLGCVYIDPNPYTSPNNEGHNYFLSQNPYTLNSYAGFGEVYYNIIDNLKLTGGLRWTEDRKHFVDIPSELLVSGYGYPITGIVDQQWDQLTGRAVANWTPKLDFTDQTLMYASYAHGYKAGGANPPGAVLLT
ncbi:MAG TPA: TonB-dependent receptor, partial [Rhizomicrobium sp.]